MKKWKTGFLLVVICVCYGLTTLYSAYISLPTASQRRGTGERMKPIAHQADALKHNQLDIWDTCGLGLYLWRNVLHGEISRYNVNDGWIQSSLVVDDVVMRYSLGYGLTPDHALLPSRENLLIVVNARDEALVPGAKLWLDHVLENAYISKVAVMVLGSETCDNEWLRPYLQERKVKFVFLVYDSPLIDDEFVFQWPLGVASYRDFPSFDQGFLDLTARRQYDYNFIGTVYPKSSRVKLMNTLHQISNETKGYTKIRDSWVAEEDPESMKNYQHVLLSSDLTLSPAGRNPECYRTYEALELGSIPVVEDATPEGTCNLENQNASAPHILLKRYEAPFPFVKDWETELPAVLEKYRLMSHEMKVRSRINVIRWYVDFKEAMRKKFLAVTKAKFF